MTLPSHLPYVVCVPEWNSRKNSGRKHCFKIATMAIGALIGTAALGGVATALALVSSQMRLLEDVAAACLDWSQAAFGHENHNSTAPSPHSPTHQIGHHGVTGHPTTEGAMHTFIGAIGVLIISLGIPNIIHFVISAQLVFGAWRERRSVVVRWIRFTQRTTTFYFLLTVFLVIALFAVNQMLLAALLTGLIIMLAGVVIFLLVIVDQYNCMLHTRPLPSIIFRNGDTVTVK